MKAVYGPVCATHPELKGLRVKSSRLCVECNRTGSRLWRQKNPDYSKNYGRRRYAKNKEAIKAKENARYAVNPGRKRLTSALWRKANRDKRNAYEAKRRSGKLAVPLTIEQRAKVTSLYAEARAMTKLAGEPYHVDHIKPLAKGGLHHPDNLQVLRGVNNMRKGVREA